MEKNFSNVRFEMLFRDIEHAMPQVIFNGIIITYLITASLNVFFLPLPLYLSIPAALVLQFGRFAVVFIDFLNPSAKKSTLPNKVALGATIVALLELWFALSFEGREFYAMFLFVGAIICFGYVLEITFIDKGIEAYGIGTKAKVKRQRKAKANLNRSTTQATPIRWTSRFAL